MEKRDDLDASAVEAIDEPVVRDDQLAKRRGGVEVLGDPAAGFRESLQAMQLSEDRVVEIRGSLGGSLLEVGEYA